MLLQELSRAGFMDAFANMERLQSRLNRVLSGAGPAGGSLVEFPALNVWTSEDSALVTAEIPGIEPEDIEILVVNDTLTLRGNRKAEVLPEGATCHRQERASGKFSRTLQLPFRIEPAQVEAAFRKGVLEITLPRAAEDKPRKISVRAE